MSRTRLPWVVLHLLLVLGSGKGIVVGQEMEPIGEGVQAHPGESLQVLLVTLGQGDAVWERFGHNALWIRDREAGGGAAYNWGIFSFHQEGFIPRLIRGTMLYSMAPADPMALIEGARGLDRRVWIQELALTPTQKLDLLAFVQWNALPENREYRYDYYRDNCSTRVRDALDRVLDGRLREASEMEVTPHSYRWHTRRLLKGRPAPYLGIQFVLGPEGDRPITGWEEMFLPLRLKDWVGRLEVPNGEGGSRPLVMSEDAFADSQRPPPAQEPPRAMPWFLLAAVLWGGGLLLAVPLGCKGSWLGRAPAFLLGFGWVLTATLSGTLLMGAWIFTDHFFWFRNMNLLQVSPLFFPILLPFLIFLFQGRFPGWGRDMVAALAVISLVGWGMQFVPNLGQHNGEVLAFTLPMNLSLLLAVSRLSAATDRGRKVAGPGEAAEGAPPPSHDQGE